MCLSIHARTRGRPARCAQREDDWHGMVDVWARARDRHGGRVVATQSAAWRARGIDAGFVGSEGYLQQHGDRPASRTVHRPAVPVHGDCNATQHLTGRPAGRNRRQQEAGDVGH
ncbi:hypothetical protein E2562_036748 [Oryza meyeriana var. granulata]|uniref:Uncharacterized protein n=1 Tax=Oryza meyeriana var. granulata TaxID=110450 RepID=A0A6G1DTN1_9ORYZ|nr:hypothetical protein E2562_036748 [Oryza meyeriana var. granulata]